MKAYERLFESDDQHKSVEEQIRLLELDRQNEIESLKNPKYKNKHEIQDRIDAIDGELHRLESLN